MRINVYIELGGERMPYLSVFYGIYDKLTKTYPSIEFNLIEGKSMKTRETLNSPGSKYSSHFMIIENDESKKYIVVSYWDKLGDLICYSDITLWDMENCVEIIATAGTHDEDIYYRPLGVETTPFSYLVSLSYVENIIEKLYNEKVEKKYPEKLSFRGYVYLFRKFLSQNELFDIRDDIIPQESYFKELNEYYLNFSINGAGEICSRDIEILGLGNALFRTKLRCKFHNELIPNYHYISVDIDDISDELPQKTYWEEVSIRLLNRFEEVKNDHDYIRFVGENGRKWYLENGTIASNIEIANKIIDLKKLYE